MQVTHTPINDTSIKLIIIADPAELEPIKQQAVRQLGRNVKVQGFRAGKAPKHIIERQIDQSVLQTEFLEHAVNDLYLRAVQQESFRPIKAPEISITKFVPFTTLEFSAEVEVIGTITLPDYKKIKLSRTPVKVAAKDIDEVITNLRTRAASKEDVKRVSKAGDQVTIDFAGVDAKSNESISGADGKDYPLVLGSKAFIPGFEDELVGLKADAVKTFTLTFPKDYGMATLQNRKVTFTVTVHSVQKLIEPKLDDAFAASVGPFKTLAELKADIKKQLLTEREQQARSDYNNQLLQKLVEKTTVAIPASLVESELDRLEEEERNNIVYRGQTWQEHLDSEGVDDAAHREKNRTNAEVRIKAGLILTEVAERESIKVTPDELDMQIELLRGRYSDPQMLAELDKPEGRRDISNRLLTEKIIDTLAGYASVKV
jgi:trigger factor